MKLKRLSPADVKRWIPKRPLDSHKGQNGHVLIVAGSRGMSGAAVLTALGALRIGAGLVSVAVPEKERAGVAAQLPEVLSLGLPETPEGTISEGSVGVLDRYLGGHNVNALVVGPGLSMNTQVAHAVRGILDEYDLPLVLDADGLNNIKADDLRGYERLIITPHLAELSRLLNIDRSEIRKNREHFTRHAGRDMEAVCVLKGRDTLISDGQQTSLNPTGHPAMASGGMGDVLSGVIGGLLAQGLDRWSAACAGAYLHGLAGQICRISDRGLLAREVAHTLPQALAKVGLK